MSTFIFVIAYFAAIMSSLLLIFRILGFLTYSKRDRLLDQIKGIRSTFPVFWPFVISFVAWTYIIIRPY